MPQPVTLAHLAAALGISKMTVSRALRGAPHVQPELAARIRQTAEQMGYTPDPEVARLMTHLRRARSQPGSPSSTLALVWTEPPGPLTVGSWSQLLLSGLNERAERLGYRLEPFEVGPGALSVSALVRILTHRGIQGILVAPLSRRARGNLQLPWERFSTVVIGLGLISPPLHRVHHHHFQGMVTTLTELRKLGHQRIGFSVPAVLDQRMFSAWSAAFLAHHPLGPAQAASLLNRHREGEREPFLTWVSDARPEVLIQSGHDLGSWLKPLPPSEQPRLATLNWSLQHPGVPGIDQRSAEIGRAAIDLLAAQLHQNERGIPDCAKTLMIEGRWQPSCALTPSAAVPRPLPL